MTGSAETGLATMLAIVGGVGVLVGIAVYVWYALALSRLFPRIDGEGWKGWVPVLNEAEILARGGVPAWSVVFYFIPLVQLYGLYLKVVATHRINRRFGRGAGYTVLAILLPPVWATLLAWGTPPLPEGDRLDALQPGPRRNPQPTAAPARDASGYTIPSLAPHSSAAPEAPALIFPDYHAPAPVPDPAASEPSAAAPAASAASTWGAPAQVPAPPVAPAPAAAQAPAPSPSGAPQFVVPLAPPLSSEQQPAFGAPQPPSGLPQAAAPQPPTPAAAPQPAAQPPAPFNAPQPPAPFSAPQPPAPAAAPQPPAPFSAPQPPAPQPPAPAPQPPAPAPQPPAPASQPPAPEPHPTTGIMAAMSGAPVPPAPAADAPAAQPPVAAAPQSVRPAPPSFQAGGADGADPEVPTIRPAPTPIVPEPAAVAPARIAPVDAVSAPVDAAAAPLAGLAPDVDKTVVSPRPTDDDLDATVVVARKRGVRRSLVLDDGRSFALSGASVVIGRNPIGEPGEQRLAISDTTRTLSKTHARLVVQEDEWRLTDLHATNGVVVVADDGSETLLDPGESVIGNGRFILGEVGMHVVAERDS